VPVVFGRALTACLSGSGHGSPPQSVAPALRCALIGPVTAFRFSLFPAAMLPACTPATTWSISVGGPDFTRQSRVAVGPHIENYLRGKTRKACL